MVNIGASRPGVSARLICGHVLDVLRSLPDSSVHCIVTSPPYWGLRDYKLEPQVWGGDASCAHEWGADLHLDHRGTQIGKAVTVDARESGRGAFCLRCQAWRGSLGLEPTIELYLAHLLEVFSECWRVLRTDGTMWVNIGDSYAHGGNGSRDPEGWPKQSRNNDGDRVRHAKQQTDLKPKDLCLIPFRLALALQAAGWWVRMDNVWAKPAPMPESVTDRPTRSHEYVFLLSKAERYFYDADAVRERDKGLDHPRSVLNGQPSLEPTGGLMPSHKGLRTTDGRDGLGRNLRSVWTFASIPFPEAHFAVFPPELPERCIKAGTSEAGCCAACGTPWRRETYGPGGSFHDHGADLTQGQSQDGSRRKRQYVENLSRPRGTLGWRPACRCNVGATTPCTVLDPFGGAGTTAVVALRLGRNAISIDLSPDYIAMQERRIQDDQANAHLWNGAAQIEVQTAEQAPLFDPSPLSQEVEG